MWDRLGLPVRLARLVLSMDERDRPLRSSGGGLRCLVLCGLMCLGFFTPPGTGTDGGEDRVDLRDEVEW